MTAPKHGGSERVSTKAKFAGELRVVGETLARAREGRGLKQADVAARLGLPASHLSKIEKGARRIDVVELVELARAMEADPAELMREIAAALDATEPRRE